MIIPPAVVEAPLLLRLMSAFTICFTTSLIAITLPQAQVVFGLVGSLLSSMIVLIIPALLSLRHECVAGGGPVTSKTPLTLYVVGSAAMLVFGCIIAVLGTVLYCEALAKNP